MEKYGNFGNYFIIQGWRIMLTEQELYCFFSDVKYLNTLLNSNFSETPTRNHE